ncbi:hypothetical protein BH23PLA1_BH23PLA1_24640 [soil metagenome]
MSDRSTPPPTECQGPAPLWALGQLRLRIRPPDGRPGRVLRIARPFALIGRGAGADLRINAPDASTRHAYLHLDHRGLFGVDLATRTGTRFSGAPLAAAWLRPGEAFEIADHQIEVLEAALDPNSPFPPPGPASNAQGPIDPLADASKSSLVRLTLFPHQPPWEPRDVGSELLFLGRGLHCGIQVVGESVARVHAVLFRNAQEAFVVDLSGGRTQINDRAVPRAAPLREGDVLAIGSVRFEVRVLPPEAPRPSLPTRKIPVELAETLLVPRESSGWSMPDLPAPFPNDVQAQGAVLAWLVQTVQASQGEALRRQGEFQHALTDMVRQICLDNASMLQEHLQRMESINTELSSLRDEIRRRLGPTGPSAPPTPPPPPPLRIAPVEPSTDPEQSTSWLIDRVHRLEEDNRSTWRDLLGRLGGGGS